MVLHKMGRLYRRDSVVCKCVNGVNKLAGVADKELP
jgi:hypothetical protein